MADKAGIYKILVEEDLVKAPFYDGLRLHPGNSMLVTERDKVAHKHTVNSTTFHLLAMLILRTQRRLLSPGFSLSYLNGLEPLMQECMQEFERFLDSKCDKSHGAAVIDMQGILGNLAFVWKSSLRGL